jgi:hypothetical protein
MTATASTTYNWRDRLASKVNGTRELWREHLAAMDERRYDAARKIERRILGIKSAPMPEEVKAYFQRPEVKAKAAENAKMRREERRRAKAMMAASKGDTIRRKG